MSIRDTLDTIYLCWLSKPKAERELYQIVRQRRVQSIVELGLDRHERSSRLIRLARRFSPDVEVRYSGVDLFDARSEELPPLTLKATHKLLSNSGATIRLIPGDAFAALARTANQLQETQLLIISADHDSASLARAWRYIPRMLSQDAVVIEAIRSTGETQFRSLTTDEIRTRSHAAERQRRAA